MKKLEQCKSNPGVALEEYNECFDKDTDHPWCYTKTHLNRSHVRGEWGYCYHSCNASVRSVSGK